MNNTYISFASKTDKSREKMANVHKGRKLSPATKQKISKSLKGNQKLSESLKGKNNWTKDLHWFNDGKKNFYCKECPLGCVKGRLKKLK